ncbi:MAG TPA: hypothetical protein VFL13_12760 [Candidatus Baltobacteraceae bacterium]|nr:hypothetical protein [Candidatus Baltobacteraceae bacterium]
MATRKKQQKGDEAPEGSWSWFKEWTGYLVTLLPYVSSGIVLLPKLSIVTKGAILLFFAILVLAIRVVHEKAGLEVTDESEKEKKPGASS